MASVVDVKLKEPALDVDFQWGKMQQQDISGQFTRSMMEMRKPKAFELIEAPALQKQIEIRDSSSCNEIETPVCPLTTHSLNLLNYIKQVKVLIFQLENRTYVSLHGYINQIAELSTPPPFIPENPKLAATASSRSRSSSSGKSTEEMEDKFLFAAPEPHSDFRLGVKISHFPQMDDATSSRILKKSIATVAAHAGYDESTMSSLNVLTGVAESFMISFSKSLRDAADVEAETGSTAFFDCLDQALHESGCSSFKEIENFWQTRIVKRHKSLQKEASRLSKILQSMKNPNSEASRRSVKPEKTQQSFSSSSYGKWTPVTGMSSSPFQPAATGETSRARWVGGNDDYSIKSEPYDSAASSSGYAFISAPQSSNPSVKNEHGGSI